MDHLCKAYDFIWEQRERGDPFPGVRAHYIMQGYEFTMIWVFSIARRKIFYGSTAQFGKKTAGDSPCYCVALPPHKCGGKACRSAVPFIRGIAAPVCGTGAQRHRVEGNLTACRGAETGRWLILHSDRQLYYSGFSGKCKGFCTNCTRFCTSRRENFM